MTGRHQHSPLRRDQAPAETISQPSLEVRCTPVIADIRVYSLRGKGDPCSSKNIRCSHTIFPVLLSKEFRPQLLVDAGVKRRTTGPDFEEIPCIFPRDQGNGAAETRSQQPPSTANLSR